MHRLRISLLVLLFVLAVTLACGLTGPTATPTEHVSVKATATQDISVFVNATLTALAPTQSPTDLTPTQSPTSVPPTTPIPSDTPVPTETSTPTLPPSPTLPLPTPTQQALRVAYVKNGNVWLWTQGGSTQPLTTAGYVVSLDLSSDGQVVAFQRDTIPFHPELWAVNSDGTGERVLVSAADFLALLPGSPDPDAAGIGPFQYGWRPGTHILAYNTRPLFEGPGLGGHDDLRLVDADTLVKTTLFEFGQGGKFYFSPDGSRMVIVTPKYISMANADGSHLRFSFLVYPSVITYSEYYYYPHPIWAQDSSSLRVAIPPEDPMAKPAQFTAFWYLPITDGSPAVLMCAADVMGFDWPDEAFSPDFSRIAYLHQTGEPADNLRELHIVNPDCTGNTIYYTGESVTFGGWNPDSDHFVFSQRGSGPMHGTHIGRVGGGYETLSTDPSKIFDLRWVDETRYLYAWVTGTGSFELHLNAWMNHILLIDTFDNIPSFDFAE